MLIKAQVIIDISFTIGHAMLILEPNTMYSFDYINYRGEASRRTARMINIKYGNTPYHPEDQFIFTAFDIEKNANRDFAMRDMRNITAVE